jgi:hypothetical protein
MKIESLIRRPHGTKVQLGNKEYHFTPDATGRHVADVHHDDHIEALLKHDYAYVEAVPAEDLKAGDGSTIVVPPKSPEEIAEKAERAELEAEYERKFMKKASTNFTLDSLREQIENGMAVEAPKNAPQTKADEDKEAARAQAQALKDKNKPQTTAQARAAGSK